MTEFVNDTFTDTSGTALVDHTGETGASWTRLGLANGPGAISDANRVRCDNATQPDISFASGTPAGTEYDVEADLVVITVSGKSGIAGRVSETDNAYFVYTEGSAWSLYKVVAGSYTLLGTYSQSLSTSTTYAVKLEIRDAAKKVYIDTVERISSADDVITTAGKAGVWLESNDSNSTGFHLDNFTATDAAGGGGSATITIDPGTYSLTGTAISLEQGYKIPIDPGTYNSVGTPIDLEQGYKVDIGLGSYSLTGTDIGLERGYLVSIDPGSYSLSGTDIALEFNRVIQITPGVYSYDGTDVSLISGETITIEAGSYTLSGTDVSLKYNREIAITPGVYTVTGTDINLEQGYEIALDAGSYSITGVDVTFNEGFTFSLDAGVYAIATKLGPSFGDSYTNDNSVGTHAWSMPENAGADDENDAFVQTSGALNTQYLKALNFSDPSIDAEIVGISVEVYRMSNLGGSNPTEFLRLVVDGVVVGEEKSGTIVNGLETYGGALDTWELSLTRDQVASNNFGVVYRATAGFSIVNSLNVDFIRMSIYYLDPVGLLYKRVLDVTPGVYTYTGTDVTLVVAGESIEGGQFIVGQSYIPGFKQAEIYVPGFQQAESFNPGFKQAEVN